MKVTNDSHVCMLGRNVAPKKCSNVARTRGSCLQRLAKVLYRQTPHFFQPCLARKLFENAIPVLVLRLTIGQLSVSTAVPRDQVHPLCSGVQHAMVSSIEMRLIEGTDSPDYGIHY